MDKLTAKNYAKYDKPFMLFGSVMNAMQGTLGPDNWEEIAPKVWEWARGSVSEFVDEMYSGQEAAAKDEGEQAL